MNWKKPLIDVLSVAAFFSRLPFWKVRSRIDPHAPAEPLGKLAWCFPISGGLIALPVAIALTVLAQLSFPPLVLAGITIALLTASTGALHEDGLADLCDGFGGGATADRKLEIMRDSTIGTYGAVGLCLSLMLRIFSFAALLTVLTPMQAAILVVAIASISRTAMLWQWRTSHPARNDGLARSQQAPTAGGTRVAAAIAATIVAAVLLPIFGLPGTIIALAASGVLIWGMCHMCERQVGGYTGDTLGASQQLVEVSLLTLLSASIGANLQ
ncbi:MAG: adenosylcobinamide-GDP ribazoletransferase [Pseudomonadota bacterium]